MAVVSIQKQSPGADAIFCAAADSAKFNARDIATIELAAAGGTGAVLVDTDFTSNPIGSIATEQNWIPDKQIFNYSVANSELFEYSTCASPYPMEFLEFTNLSGENDLEFLAKVACDGNHFPRYSMGSVGFRIDNSAKSGYFAGIGAFGYNTSITMRVGKFTGGVYAHTALFSTGAVCGQDEKKWFWIKLRVLGNDIKFRYWADGDPEPVTWNFEGSDTDYSGTHHGLITYCYHNYYGNSYWSELRVDGSGYSSTSPVYYAKYDSGNDNTVWTSEKQKILTNLLASDSGTVKAKFGFSNINNGALDTFIIDSSLSATWLTPDASDEVTNPGGTGRYMYIAYQFVSDGTQQTSLALMEDDAETVTIEAGGGGSAKKIIKSTNKMGVL